jgi:hypothetical protein
MKSKNNKKEGISYITTTYHIIEYIPYNYYIIFTIKFFHKFCIKIKNQSKRGGISAGKNQLQF